MTLEQLRYFQAVCKYDGVRRAAEALNVSQPSVSNAIANLEKEFGLSLFKRQHRHLIITKEGTIMLEMTQKLLAQADQLAVTMRNLGSGHSVLRLGVPPMVGSLMLPVLFNEHFSKNSNLQVQIVEDDSSGLRRLLSENQIDMAFLPHSHPFGQELTAEPLMQLQNVCCVSRSHPLASCMAIPLTALVNEPLILFKNSFFQTERILGEFTRQACEPNVLLYTKQLSTIQKMIASNAAVGFMFEFLLESTPDIIGIPLDPPIKTEVSLVWNSQMHISAEMKDLIRFIRDFHNHNNS